MTISLTFLQLREAAGLKIYYVFWSNKKSSKQARSEKRGRLPAPISIMMMMMMMMMMMLMRRLQGF